MPVFVRTSEFIELGIAIFRDTTQRANSFNSEKGITTLLTVLSLTLVLISGGLAWAETPAGGDWPQWRGPNRDGLCLETGLLDRWPQGGPPAVWRTAGLGIGYSNVAIADGRIFTMGSHGKDEYVLAFDARTGNALWRTRNGKTYRNSHGDGPRGTPTVDGDLLYALGANGDLACLRVDSGRVRWNKNILQTFGASNINFGISESVLIDGNLLLCNPGGTGASLVALDKYTGDVVWKTGDDRAAYSAPVAANVGGVRQIIFFTANGLVAARRDDGRILWRYGRVANEHAANVATPIVHDGYVFASSDYSAGCALLQLTSTGSTTTAREVYFNRKMRNHHDSCVLLDGYLYGYSGGVGTGVLTCMGFKTGRVAWKHRSVGKGSLVYADGHLYLRSEQGPVALAEATPEGYREKGRFDQPHRSDKSAWAYPVVAAGRLYLRDQNILLCYDVRGRNAP